MRSTTTGIRKPIVALLTALLLTPPGALSAADTVFDPCRFGATA